MQGVEVCSTHTRQSCRRANGQAGSGGLEGLARHSFRRLSSSPGQECRRCGADGGRQCNHRNGYREGNFPAFDPLHPSRHSHGIACIVARMRIHRPEHRAIGEGRSQSPRPTATQARLVNGANGAAEVAPFARLPGSRSCERSARRTWSGARHPRAPNPADVRRWCSGRRCPRPAGPPWN